MRNTHERMIPHMLGAAEEEDEYEEMSIHPLIEKLMYSIKRAENQLLINHMM
ncbi:hypothetical protein [Alkalihalobacillus trypoxylicola]|uniref:hypothetical protein n=1 Tax=Alkalihalobacillus trypoxylicola TaxID=519424 RepID=UPI000AE27061|nr:hypothetical protein [Alkalihalobacillus trypoxylicola]